jgi:hypothetical protein
MAGWAINAPASIANIALFMMFVIPMTAES